jgi:hypothetical protein
MVAMTDTTPEPSSETTATAEPERRDRRWDESRRRGGRPFRVAALVVTLAGVVFVIAVIFWSGFILGTVEGGEGGHHHGDGGRNSSQEGEGSEKHDGMSAYGVAFEQPVSSAAFAR